VVHELVEGRSNTIKERTIALEVFGKSPRFDPGSDSLVRVKAREVRKRLTEFYVSAPDTPLRFELPVGSYIPIVTTISPEDSAPQGALPSTTSPATGRDGEMPEGEHITTSRFSRRRVMWLLGGSLAAGATAATRHLWQHSSSNLDLLWKPVFATGEPLLIFVPLLKVQGGKELTDRVGMGTAVALSQAAQYLTKSHYPYRLRFGGDLTFSQLKEQPSLLLGGYSSQWTLGMTRGLRFVFGDQQPMEKGNYVLDTQTGRRWGPVISENGFSDTDYSLLCRLFDGNSGQVIFIAAGITTFGTESAASFLFSDDLFSTLLKGAPNEWATKNFQAVIETAVVGLTPSTPRVVDSHFW
jgi:hypothetical protein